MEGSFLHLVLVRVVQEKTLIGVLTARTGPNKSDNSFWILGAGWGWLSQNPPFYIYWGKMLQFLFGIDCKLSEVWLVRNDS